MPTLLLSPVFPGRSLRDYISHIRTRNTREAIEHAGALEGLQDTVDSLVDVLTSVVDYINSGAGSGSGGSTPAGLSLGEYSLTVTADVVIPAPAANYDLYAVYLRQDGTGGRNVTWDPIFRAEQLANYPANEDPNSPSVYFFARHANEYWLISANIGI